MKKLVVLILIAVVVGFFISQTDSTEQENDNGGNEDSNEPVVEADTETSEAQAVPEDTAMDVSPGPSVAPSDDSLENNIVASEGSEGAARAGETSEDDQQNREGEASGQDRDAEEGDEDEEGKEDENTEGDEDESEEPGSKDLQRGLSQLEQGRDVEAREILTRVYREGDDEERERAHDALKQLNSELVFTPRVVDGATVHTVESGETLATIASKYGVSWRMIQRLNDIDRPQSIRVGQELKILDGPQRIVVDKSDFRLALFIDGDFIKEYEVGLGKNDKTPEGEFEVEEMLVEPDWYPPWGGVVEYGDEEHLIGDRWIGLSDKPGAVGYGIHGTNDPDSIGTMCSNGCIRLINEEVKELYDLVNTGATVIIKE